MKKWQTFLFQFGEQRIVSLSEMTCKNLPAAERLDHCHFKNLLGKRFAKNTSLFVKRINVVPRRIKLEENFYFCQYKNLKVVMN